MWVHSEETPTVWPHMQDGGQQKVKDTDVRNCRRNESKRQISKVIWRKATSPVAAAHIQQSGFRRRAVAQCPRRFTSVGSHPEVRYTAPAYIPLKIAHTRGGIWAPSNTIFLRPTWVCPQTVQQFLYGSSLQCAQYTDVTPITLLTCNICSNRPHLHTAGR